MVRHGMASHGMAWYGIVWCGVVWSDVVWHSIVVCAVLYYVCVYACLPAFIDERRNTCLRWWKDGWMDACRHWVMGIYAGMPVHLARNRSAHLLVVSGLI